MAGLPVTAHEEETYFRENINSPALYEHIARNASDYACIFIPYLFGTTYYGLIACGGRAFLIPCLHDEAYARLPRMRAMVESAEHLILNSPAELKLLHQLCHVRVDAYTVMGEGVDTDLAGDTARFRSEYRIDRPFVLYAGRKDAGKNVDLLVAFFRRYRQQRPGACDLVLIGGGPLGLSVGEDEGIHDLGYLPLQHKYDAYAAAAVLCQPSTHESFSLVMMEAWAAGTPALVNARCAVTRDHVEQSNGGLYFDGYDEFELCLDVLLNRPDLRRQLGAGGRRYVRTNYAWDTIVERYCVLIREFWERHHGGDGR